MVSQFGRIVQLELPLVDSEKYAQINRALVAHRASKNLKEKAAKKIFDKMGFEKLMKKAHHREALQEILLALSQVKNAKNMKADIKLLKEKIATLEDIKLQKELESLCEEKITLPKEDFNEKFIKDATKSITKYIAIEDAEIEKSITLLPSKKELFDPDLTVIKDGKESE